jgi:hypothetical protein
LSTPNQKKFQKISLILKGFLKRGNSDILRDRQFFERVARISLTSLAVLRSASPMGLIVGEAQHQSLNPRLLDRGVAVLSIHIKAKDKAEVLSDDFLNGSRDPRLGGRVGVSKIDLHIISLSTSCPRGQRTAGLPQSDWLHR